MPPHLKVPIPDFEVTSDQVAAVNRLTLAFATFLGLAGPFLNSSLSL